MLLVFVAHWCPHCQVEVPRLVDLYGGEAELDGVELVAVATGSDPSAENYPPGDWLASEGWPGRTMVDDEQASAMLAYGGGSYPYLLAIDADGNVVARTSGEQGEEKPPGPRRCRGRHRQLSHGRHGRAARRHAAEHRLPSSSWRRSRGGSEQPVVP